MKPSCWRCAAALALLLGLSPPLPSHAAPAPPKAEEPPAEKLLFDRPQAPVPAPKVRGPKLALSIKEAVSLALARNFDITIESYNPGLRENDLTREQAAFDPALTARANTNRSKTDTVSTFGTGGRPRTLSTQTGSVGIEKRVVTGAQVSLLFESIRESTNSSQNLFDPNYTARLTLSVSQPLLKNFGVDVNEAQIRIAAGSRDQALEDYRRRVIEVVDQVEQAYWDLVFARANFEFSKKSLDLAKDLLRRNRIQVEVGTLAPIEILEAEATVAAREETVIVAERAVQDQEDLIKRLLNITEDIPSWSISIEPTDKPTRSPVQLEEMNTTIEALRKRAELERARIEVEKRKIEMRRAQQNLLPELNLEASASNSGLKDKYSDAFDRETGNKGYELEAGLRFRYPFGNRDAEANYRSTRLQHAQAVTTLHQLEQSIVEEVRRGVRRVRTDAKRIDSTRLARRLAEERLAAQEKKFTVGLSTSRDILEDQESLANALTNETRALVDYNKSLANLGRTTHSTLGRFHIRLGDPRPNKEPAPPQSK